MRRLDVQWRVWTLEGARSSVLSVVVHWAMEHPTNTATIHASLTSAVDPQKERNNVQDLQNVRNGALDTGFWGSDFGFPRSLTLGQQQAEKQGWGSAESLGARSLFAFATFISVARGEAVGGPQAKRGEILSGVVGSLLVGKSTMNLRCEVGDDAATVLSQDRLTSQLDNHWTLTIITCKTK